MFWIAIAFATGILLGEKTSIGWSFPLGISAAFLMATFILRHRRFRLILLVAAFFFAGCAETSWRAEVPVSRVSRLIDEHAISEGDPVELFGRIAGLPEPAAGGMFLDVRSAAISQRGVRYEASGIVRLFAVAPDEEHAKAFEGMHLAPGTEVSAVFRIKRGERFLNPGVPKARDLLDQKGIDATGSIKSPLLMTVSGAGGAGSYLHFASSARNWLISEFQRLLGRQTAGVMIASLLGDKYFLDKRTAELFREGGTFHVLVISGLHITFIGGLIFWFTALFTRNAWLQFVASSATLWLFALAVGGEVPVVRAAVMFTVLLFLRALNRDTSSMNAYGISALTVLAWRPMDLYSPSFILTFICTGAIVSIAVPTVGNLRASGRWTPSKMTPLPPNVGYGLKSFCETLYWRDEEWNFAKRRNAWTARIFKQQMFVRVPFALRRAAARLFEGLMVSLIVQICLMPFQIRYFHRVSTGGILLNLWVEAVMALETFAALIAVLIARVSDTFAMPFARLTELLNALLLYPHEFFAWHFIASVRVPIYSFMDVLEWLYIAPLAYFAAKALAWDPFRWDVRASGVGARRVLSVSASAILLAMNVLLIFHPYSAPTASGKLRIDFLDVGQGDSMLVTFPNAETMLIDGGGRASFGGSDEKTGNFEPDVRSIGEAVVSEFLWEKGYSRIDYVLATHADTDHMQGLSDIVKNFDVRHVYVARLATGDPEFVELAAEMSRRNLSPELVARGERLEVGGVFIDVLNPSYSSETQARYGNAESLVLSLRYGARRFLLTGDVEKEGEQEMLARPESLRADLVKVAHHGSRTSSTEEFVRAVQASYAVISVGRTSQFGHPHEEVVERWIKSGAKVLRTGEAGTITVETDGKMMEVRTFLGGG